VIEGVIEIADTADRRHDEGLRHHIEDGLHHRIAGTRHLVVTVIIMIIEIIEIIESTLIIATTQMNITVMHIVAMVMEMIDMVEITTVAHHHLLVDDKALLQAIVSQRYWKWVQG